jgi:putative YhbY family RNA-binding protein
MTPLSSARRSELRAEAHKLSPVVIIGDKNGLTELVLAEIDRSLKAHELIKVRAATDDRDARNAWFEAICEKLEAHPVQQIGKIFVIYRENPKEEPVGLRGPRRGRHAPRCGARSRWRSARRNPRRDCAGRERRRPSPRPSRAPSNVPDVHYLELLHPARSPNLGDVARGLPDERLGDRRRVGDLRELEVGLVLAHDLVGDGLLARGVDQLHRRAEHHAVVVVEQLRVDDLRVGELRLELDDAALDEALALARRLVLGVLGDVALGARLGDRE